MIILKYLLIFAVFSIIGWFIEVTYRSTINKKFINPGFMTGCVIPLYGFGVILLNLICVIFNRIDVSCKLVIIFLLSALILTILEYITGIIMLNLFQVKLWDYSNRKFNYKGIICLRFSIAWGLLALLFYLLIFPNLNEIIASIIDSKVLIFMLGIFYGILLIDFCISIDFFNKILLYSKKIKKIINLEKLRVETLKANSKKTWDKIYPYRYINKFLKEKIKK